MRKHGPLVGCARACYNTGELGPWTHSVASLYRRYRKDLRSVDDRWALFFAGYDFVLADRRERDGEDLAVGGRLPPLLP